MGLLVKTLVAFLHRHRRDVRGADAVAVIGEEGDPRQPRPGAAAGAVQAGRADRRAQAYAIALSKIDPNIGKDAWRGTLNRQISESINAGRLVPLPPRTNFPGVPRF